MNWDAFSCKISQLKVLSPVSALEWGRGWVVVVYKFVMSTEMSITSFGNFVFSVKLLKSVVSLRYDHCFCAIGWRILSMQ